MQNDWDTEWGAEWKCAATSLDFCLSEGMCNYPDSCPFNSRGEWGEDTLVGWLTFFPGGGSIKPHKSKTVTADDGTVATSEWNYK